MTNPLHLASYLLKSSIFSKYYFKNQFQRFPTILLVNLGVAFWREIEERADQDGKKADSSIAAHDNRAGLKKREIPAVKSQLPAKLQARATRRSWGRRDVIYKDAFGRGKERRRVSVTLTPRDRERWTTRLIFLFSEHGRVDTSTLTRRIIVRCNARALFSFDRSAHAAAMKK